MHPLMAEASQHYKSVPSLDQSVVKAVQSPKRWARFRLLRELRVLSEEYATSGWDGYVAARIAPEAHQQARRFLMTLPFDIPLPSIGAEPDGRLTLEWYRGPDQVLSVSVSHEDLICYAAILGRRKRAGTEPFCEEVPEDILRILRSLFLV
jgi:hypothetical protein